MGGKGTLGVPCLSGFLTLNIMIFGRKGSGPLPCTFLGVHCSAVPFETQESCNLDKEKQENCQQHTNCACTLKLSDTDEVISDEVLRNRTVTSS